MKKKGRKYILFFVLVRVRATEAVSQQKKKKKNSFFEPVLFKSDILRAFHSNRNCRSYGGSQHLPF